MAAPSLPSRVNKAISAFVKLARDVPTAKADEEAELFNTQLPLALGKASAAAQAHVQASRDRDAATRFVVEEVAKQDFYTAMAGVVDLLSASPATRLAVPLSTMRALPTPLNQGWTEERDDSLTGALLLYSGCLKGFLVLGERDRPGPILNHCTAKRAEALTKSGLYLCYVRLVRQLEGSMHDTAGREPAAPDAHGQPADDVPYRPWIDIASSTAALLGSTTFAAECIEAAVDGQGWPVRMSLAASGGDDDFAASWRL
ncbi:hypothetical protein FOA52_015366 [Chlamydomonas sp. UWO 241]|nr:hypothetical protein FOA52_015366 [Chlamydomonas sp. UWO 241]